MSISYADAVRDYLYQNPEDRTLIEYGKIHPGLSFHIGVAWIMAYNLLDSVLSACNAPSLPGYHNAEPRAAYPLPILHDSLIAKNVTSEWKSRTEQDKARCEKEITPTQCIYKWVAARQDASTAGYIQKTIEQNAVFIDGWKAVGYPIRKPRRTFIAEKMNATFVLQFNDISTPINSLMILVS